MHTPRSGITAAVAALMLAAGCSDGSVAPAAGPAARVDVTVAPTVTVAAGSAAGTFTVKVADAAGRAVAGTLVTFVTTGAATVSPTAATTDASGLAATQVTVGTVAGSATVRATVAGVTTIAMAALNVVAGPAAKVAVTPRTLRLVSVGDTARIAASLQDQYGNATSSGTIGYSVQDPTLLSVDQTGLVRVLRQGGSTLVLSTVGTTSDTTVVTVLAVGSTACTGVVNPTSMAIGEVKTFSGAQYSCLSGSATGAEFTVVAFNASTDQYNSANVSLTGNGIGAVPTVLASAFTNAALRSSVGSSATRAPQLDEDFHLGLLEQARVQTKGTLSRFRAARRATALRSSSGTGVATSVAAGIPAGAKVGDIITLNLSASSCSSPNNRGLRVAAVGTQSIVLADTLNPSNGFTDAQYQRIATNFDTLAYPVVTGAFGVPSDADGNGKVAILFTRVVNELVTDQSGYYVGGFFNPRDLFPKVGAVASENCPGSNEGEMFYMLVPAPDGINNVKHTVGFVDSTTTAVVAHEFQHLINGSRRFSINTQAEEFEQVWLNEGLSHIAEELLYYRESGFTPRLNLTDAIIRDPTRVKYGFWKNDAAANFTRFLSHLRNPGANSPFAANDELATRGAIWAFLRYAADQLGPTDGTLWRDFANSTVTGMATLSRAFGTDPMPLFRDFAIANYMDDLSITTDARFTHKSWNFRDIYTKTYLNNPTYPLKVTGLAENAKTDFSIKGGSASYARLSVDAGRDALLTFSSAGGLPNASLQFVVVRTK